MVSLVSLKYQEALYKRLTFSPQLNQIILPINNQLTLHFHSSVTPNPRLPASDLRRDTVQEYQLNLATTIKQCWSRLLFDNAAIVFCKRVRNNR